MFDGVSGNKDKELEGFQSYGLIEYACSKMARAAGIAMNNCHFFEENDRCHFTARPFDRDDTGSKLHMGTSNNQQFAEAMSP